MKKLWTLFLVLVFSACLISPAITTDVYAADGVVMTVNGTDYTNHNEGWSQAINIANGGTKTTVVLKADWNAVDGDFTCAKGTENGYLYLNDIDIDLTIDLNGYAINRGLTTPKEYGHVFKLKEGTLTITDSVGTGKITGGNVYYEEKLIFTAKKGYGGGINMEGGTLYFKGGNITGNTAYHGGGIYCDNEDESYVYILGGKIAGNTAMEFGGGIMMKNGYLHMDGGEITGNTAPTGIGICSTSNNATYLTGGKITGNQNGYAGVYISNHSQEIKIYLGGDIQIADNKDANLYISVGDLIYNACGQDGAPNDPLTEGANIHLLSEERIVSGENSMFGPNDHIYLHSEQSEYRYVTVYVPENENHTYQIYKEQIQKYMEVTVDGVTTVYDSFDDGWPVAINTAEEGTPVTVKLLQNWSPRYGEDFHYTGWLGFECGTDEGCLYINDADSDITIDLNGYTIDRGLTSERSEGHVFKIDDGKLTIIDSSEAQTGKITGAYNDGDGGAFLVEYGTLCIKGGEISGNKAVNGGAIYCNDLDDAFVEIKGGKIVDNTATENGGAIYIYDGYLDITGGEISGNTATEGAGIYWYSDNNLCITGGKITGNIAKENGGGIYHKGGGSVGGNVDNVYFGGNLQIYGNSGNGNENNVYLESLRVVNRTAGQSEKIPNVSLVDGASIGISMPATEGTVLISGPDSLFESNNFGYFFGDSSSYFVRAVFDEQGGNNTHKLFYNKWGYKDAVYPKIATVKPRENNGLISDASIDVDKQIITLKAISPDKSLFKSVVVESLVSFTTSDDTDVYWRFCDVPFDLSKPMEYKVVSKSTGTYVHCRVVVKFPDCTHSDKDGDYVCDNCEEYIFTDFTIVGYNEETKEATVFITRPGRYSLVFADYENDSLKNMDIVEYDFKEGINVVPQEVTSFTLANGDKVILWYDITNLTPVCEALTVK